MQIDTEQFFYVLIGYLYVFLAECPLEHFTHFYILSFTCFMVKSCDVYLQIFLPSLSLIIHVVL